MRKNIKRIIGGTIAIVAAIILSLVIYNIIMTFRYKAPVDNHELSRAELRAIDFVSVLKAEKGTKIWPGFDTASIPVMLYNDQFEFIHGANDIDHLLNKEELEPCCRPNMYRRPASDPQAFAVKIAGTWAGSLGVRKQMNREMYNGMKNELPFPASGIFPYFMVAVSDEMHISGIMHELFHAFQATSNENKFIDAGNAYRFLDNYPYRIPEFSDSWNREGRYLMNALYAKTRNDEIAFIDSFMTMRRERRKNAALSNGEVMAEKKLEWLEGTAKYAEAISYMAADELDPSDYSFRDKNAYWKTERKQRLPKLGKRGGDNRFYHSGSAQAFMLDRLYPGWKNVAMEDSVYLEDLLILATDPGDVVRP